ncbi:MAG: arginase family protein, partial [Bacteroidales bacterium]|nr:arginase family protein [Bacteroidales bacterium]
PDMQESLFDGILSCGNWVTKVLDTNSLVKKVLLIGPDDKLVAEVDNKYTDKVTFVCESEIHNTRHIEETLTNLGQNPIYISIDKDVLTKEEEQTNWDQGTLTTNELKKILSEIQKHHDILGVDICGTSPLVTFQMLGDNDLINDNQINAELLELFIGKQ